MGEHDDILGPGADEDLLGPPPKRKTKRGTGEYQPWTPERMERFCAAYRKDGRFGAAANAVGCSRSAAMHKRKDCPEFDKMVAEAWRDFQEHVIWTVQDFAWKGKPEPIYQGGELVGVRQVYFTRLQELEARRAVPEYREKSSLELTGNAEKPIAIDLTGLTDEELFQLKAIQERARSRGGKG